ncbi:MAG: elongator complex protein 3 [Patescibacteria group bacterium]|nr:elongator complex protein 3 [Patescibacteria group bacterium]
MIENIFVNIRTETDVSKLKRKIMREDYWRNRILSVREKINNKVDKATTMPNNPELLELYHELVNEKVADKDIDTENILKRLKVRSNSGVAVVSLLTKPYSCPGKCIYCPTEKNMPKSYLSREPAAARALLNRFDPYKQIAMRLKALTMNGHPVDKIEMILIGGTFNFYKKDYQEYFVKESFRACNNWKAKEEGREFIEENHNYSLEDLQRINESAHARIIGLSIETRPDYITPSELKWLRYLGVTKVEIGVQHLDDEVLKFNKREMTARDAAVGAELLRDYGFKIVYHMMPNLPTSNPVKDVKMFKNLYDDKYHHPDMMKIYPNMVLRGSLLYKLVTQKKIDYEAYDDQTLIEVLAQCESYVPNYTRLIRMIRDIPADYIIIGSKKSNLREEVDKYQKQKGFKQVDIRAREIRDTSIDPEDFELTETWYETENGYECFLQFENKEQNKIAGFLRLRLPKKDEMKSHLNESFANINSDINTEALKNWGIDKWKKESEKYYEDVVSKGFAGDIDKIMDNSALVRELHVYGTMKRVGEMGSQSQHTGMGKRLLIRAEEIARGDNMYNLRYNKISIISGVGVRDYYRKRGYTLEATYMVKNIK